MNVSMADAMFGPRLEGSFDFTLLFEQSFFTIGPSAFLLLASPVRVAFLGRKRARVGLGNRPLLWLKLTLSLLLFAVEVANLALWNLSSTSRTPVAVAGAALSLAGVVAMVSLHYTEHRYSYLPSLLLSLYLSVSILLEIATVRTLFLRHLVALAVWNSVALAVKVLLLGLEEVPKHAPTTSEPSTELLGDLWNRTVFWWPNTTFRGGFRSFLGVDDLSSLDKHLDSAHLASSVGKQWKSVRKTGQHDLAWATICTFQSSFWAGVVPRLCFSGFSFAQTFLINSIITLGKPKQSTTNGVVGGLVGATALVYLGIAFAKCHYMHSTYRLITSVRGGLVGLIFAKAAALDATTASDTDER